MKICNKEGCENPVFGGGYCKYHQYLRTDKKKPKPIKQQRFNTKFEYDTSYGFDSEQIMYKHILDTREAISFVSGLKINAYDIETCKCFAHVLEKAINRFPNFRLNPDAVVYLTWEEHFLWDQGSEDARKRYAEKMAEKGVFVDWNKLKLLKGKLIIQYKEKYG